MTEYVYHTVNGHKYRDIYELKPRDEFGNKEFDWVGTEVHTPNCNWQSETRFCTKFSNNCAIAKDVLDLIGELP